MTIHRTGSAPRISTTTTTSSQPLLRSGSRGPAVATLQRQLNAAGFNAGAADGIFGPKTLAAVKAFQRARGLAADGIVGPKTHAALARPAPAPAPARPAAPSRPASPAPTTGPTLKVGARGEAVRQLQSRLNAHGHRVSVDGAFGPATQAAVKAFQRAKGLAADGVVGPKTWAKLGGGNVSGGPSSGRPVNGGQTGGVTGPRPVSGGSTAQRIVDIAKREAGTLESGNNAGAITKYTGGKTGWPYCAKFVSWAYRQAGKPLPGGDKWAVADIKATIKNLGQWTDKTKLQPGMAATFSKWSHVEIVASPVHQNGKLTGYMMVGGNTTIPGTGGRQGVAHKFRSLAELEGGGFPVRM